MAIRVRAYGTRWKRPRLILHDGTRWRRVPEPWVINMTNENTPAYLQWGWSKPIQTIIITAPGFERVYVDNFERVA